LTTRAYIKADPLEDPEVLENLFKRLLAQNIQPILTEKNWKNIIEPEPFLFFRNAYLRLNNEIAIAKFHAENKHFPYLLASNGEVISVNSTAPGDCGFILHQNIEHYQPQIDPLPILLGTHQRPLYFKLTLNSLLFNLKLPKQKIYIVLSQPDEETKNIALEALKFDQVEVVLSENNLKYAFANFGAKFFNLSKFIHYEDDGILPENTRYHLPFWTCQLNHRSKTADLVTFRIFEGNWSSSFYRSAFFLQSEQITILPDILWHYTKPSRKTITPIGGMGMVIDSQTMYKNFKPPSYNSSDHVIYFNAKIICLANVPIYHIGANYDMDYPLYNKKKENTNVDKMQTGTNLRTRESKIIDLSKDWNEGYIIK